MTERRADAGRRVSTSDHLEVSAYLEIAQERSGTPSGTGEPGGAHGVVVMDFGSQYSQLIARRVREMQVYCAVVPPTASWEDVAAANPRGIILSGGPASVYDDGAPMPPAWVYQHGLPILGICYGTQALVQQLGGRVDPAESREYGHAVLHQNQTDAPIFAQLPTSMPVWMSHSDQIVELPPGFRSLAYTDSSPMAAIGNGGNILGLQFHPEVVHTANGKTILENFLFSVCNCDAKWTSDNFIEQSVQAVRDQVGSGKVICALSGGVDSAVTAALIHEAIGNQLTSIFVNNGLMRREEPERVLDTFRNRLKLNMLYVDASERFLRRLEGVVDPEQKRHIVGEEFIRVFEESAAELGDTEYLAQGTLYPDVIESQTPENRASAKIKTHHNVGGLPEHMTLKLVEPLRDLFKDEVRDVGLALGLPPEVVYRQPFPGPGLAIRVMGEVTEEKLEMLRACDWVVIDEIKGSNLYHQLWQTFAVLTDTQSVGVTGDFRAYGLVAAIRAVTSEDAMTADWVRLPYEVLARISSRIVNEVPGVTRVVYDVTSKPPGTIEWE